MVRNPAMARSRCEDQLMEAQGRLVLASNLAAAEGDERTARDALAACAIVVEITAAHTKRAG